MVVEINGEKKDIGNASSVAELLASLQLPSAKVAVERNQQLVPRAEHASTSLTTGDKIEIVHFVGGG